MPYWSVFYGIKKNDPIFLIYFIIKIITFSYIHRMYLSLPAFFTYPDY